MRNIDTYILEKLHINKDINPKIDFKKDEKILVVSIYRNEDYGYIRLYVFPFTDIKKESNGHTVISYKNSMGSIVTQNVKINSKGYYEVNIADVDATIHAVFLPTDYGIDFLDKDLENYNDRNNIYKYFDDDDQTFIDKIYDNEISVYDSDDEIKEIKRQLKNEKH